MKNQKTIDNSKLIAYSVAAGAALAVAPNAFAAIVHETDGRSFGVGHDQFIDLTMEGDNAEFELRGEYNIRPSMTAVYTFKFLVGQKHAGPLICRENSRRAKSIPYSAYIGPSNNTPNTISGRFRWGEGIIGEGVTQSHGDWAEDGQTKYCAVSFDKESGGKVYGWIKIERLSRSSGKIIDWAYEDSGNPIVAGNTGPVPEPATGLALLALGAAGIAAYRRR